MTLEEAKRLIEELRGRFDAPFSSEDKEVIEKLYAEVLRKRFIPTSCQQCYHDAVIEISCYLKRNGEMKKMCSFVLLAGAIIHSPLFMNGKVFSNENLTDDVAMRYLAQFPNAASLFQKFPDGYKVGDLPKESSEDGGKADGHSEVMSLEDAEKLLKKKESALKAAKTRLEKADTDKKVETAKKSLEKAEKDFEEAKALVEKMASGAGE